MTANMYRVGDYVYFETSSTSPYTIRRIEELNKTSNGNVEAKVMCFYRRRDINQGLIALADKHHSSQLEDEQERRSDRSSSASPSQNGTENGPTAAEHIPSAASVKTETGGENGPSNGSSNSSINNHHHHHHNNNNNNTNANDSSAASTPEDGAPKPFCDIPEKQRHQLKHRELFLSRQVETLPATHIRGKCSVTLLNETEDLLSYLNREDSFFYCLVYDPQQRTLLADKGEIRVGSKFQAEVTPLLKKGEKDDRRCAEDLETLVWDPNNALCKREIDQFLVVARSVGTFARALDCTSTVRQPSLHMSAAAASRDITLFHAMDTLHRHRYDASEAVRSLVPDGGPVLCRDEMEEWSASEANLFEEALDKYGKDFNDIRQDFLPWKSLKSIVEYYYMWKTTDRYVQQKRIKAAEAESKLKQVYIPNYTKPNPAAIPGKVSGEGPVSGRACESCYTAQSAQWYSWGPAHMQCRLCSACWMYWKRYGGLKMPTRYDGERPPPAQRQERVAHMNSMRTQKCTIAGCGKEFKLKTHLARHLATAHGLSIQPGSPRPVMKTRAAFCLVTTPLTRVSRHICGDILRPRHAARCCFVPINTSSLKQECQLRLTQAGKYVPPVYKARHRTMEPVVARLGIDTTVPKPALLYRGAMVERSPLEQAKMNSNTPSIMRKRGYEQSNGMDGPAAKRASMGVIRQAGMALKSPTNPQRGPGTLSHGNMNGGRGSGKVPYMRGTKMHMISWLDMPDDVFFMATNATRKLRKQLQTSDFKRTARNPWRSLNVKTRMPLSAITVTRERSSPALPSAQEVVVLD